MKNMIKFLLGVWSFLILIYGIKILTPGFNLIQDSFLLQQMQPPYNTGFLFVWAALLSLFLSLENRHRVAPSSLKKKIKNPFDFQEDIFSKYEDRYNDNRRFRF